MTGDCGKYLWRRSIVWVRKGSLALADHGLSAGANFVVSILLARWMRPEQYGAFALATSLLLLVVSLHQAVLLDPMSIVGPAKYQGSRKYLGAHACIHVAIGFGLLLVFGTAAVVSKALGGAPLLTESLAGLAAAAPCYLCLRFFRGAAYLGFSPGPAAVGAALYAVLFLAGLLALQRLDLITIAAVFFLMGASSIPGVVLLAVKLKPDVGVLPAAPIWQGFWERHWRFGRWELGAATVSWMGSNIAFAFTGAWLGLAEVGALRALMNLLLPVSHVAAALRRLVLPYLSGVWGQSGQAVTIQSVAATAGLYVAGATVYFAALSAFHRDVFRFLYGGQFMSSADLAPWVVLCGVFYAGANGLGMGLRAIRSPSSAFMADAFAVAASIVVGVPATFAFGLPGVVASMVVSHLAMITVSALLFRRRIRSAARPAEVQA